MNRWDYSADGFYFITLVVQNRKCHLGRIENGDMILSDWGKIIHDEWLKSFEIRKELYLDTYVFMPNHIHAIVVIDNYRVLREKLIDPPDETDIRQKERPRLHQKPKSISSFFGGFKSAVNTKIDNYIDMHKMDIPKFNRNNHFFQPSFHDRLIRDKKEYGRISNYIKLNPKIGMRNANKKCYDLIYFEFHFY